MKNTDRNWSTCSFENIYNERLKNDKGHHTHTHTQRQKYTKSIGGGKAMNKR